jgi:hypothetical protein
MPSPYSSKTTSLLIFLPRFYLYWSGISNTCVLLSKGMWSLAFRSGLGCVVHNLVMVAACRLNLTFGLAYVVYPFLESVIFFSKSDKW